VDKADDAIKTVGLIFDLFNDEFMSTEEFPFTTMPDIKYLCLGIAGIDGCSDGSCAVFKNFGETRVKVFHTFTRANPYMEEFEGCYEVLEEVQKSFLDQKWSVKYEDYSDGCIHNYSFGGKKKDREIMELWAND
jgi:hypothetical protein